MTSVELVFLKKFSDELARFLLGVTDGADDPTSTDESVDLVNKLPASIGGSLRAELLGLALLGFGPRERKSN